MLHFQEFNYLLRKLQYSDGPSDAVAALKDVAIALQTADKSDLQELLALLCSTPDHKLKVKLLSILSAYLISQNRHSDVIVTYRPLYDTIENLLSRGLPVKAKTTLNFIMALLTNDADAKNLTMFACNMLRNSGCLTTMCEIFTSGMMYQDTWIALCQSIAESCRGCEVNQSHCSHLIPVCVKRCCLGNPDVCIVLQCLVNNHRRNIQLFFESGGQSIFTRQLLQYDACIQLLCNIVQTSEQAVQVLCGSGLVHHLRDFIRLYGPYSQVSQWSTIILYHLDNRLKGSEKMVTNLITNERIHDVDPPAHSISSQQTTDRTIRFENINDKQFAKRNINHITKDALKFTTIGQQKRNSQVEKLQLKESHPMNDVNKVPVDDDTFNLFQNVIKEVIQWKSKNEFNPKKPFNPIIATNTCHQSVSQQCTDEISHKLWNTELKAHLKNDLSFADFRREFNVNKEISSSFPINNVFGETGQIINPCFNTTNESNNLQTTGFKVNLRKSTNAFQSFKARQNLIDMSEFKPTFVSTPKRKRNENTLVNSQLQNTTKISYTNQVIRNGRTRIHKPYKRNKSKNTQTIPDITKDGKQRSISVRFFNAINDSCTTLVKSVKSMFTLKKDNKNNKNSNSGNTDEKDDRDSCSYSFTNYMRERDAILLNEHTQTKNIEYEDSNSIDKDSCRTCKDTIVLQHKMATDEHLQQTIKRLKIGVNLYGCDFKKISRTLWPRDRYMTPNTLYNLYRKLIVNSGHHKKKFVLKH